MPFFDYHCNKCGHDAELLTFGSEKPACPECGSGDLEKMLGHIQPMKGGKSAPAPTGCGAPSCCRMQGGGCMN
ncbi:MAG: zinc ribbon domain-containing protein [Candidatus Hydrogenedentes bacterium]|nr:zinc ribbon domain-containing protein [Candidatus Hydrogenedentota bacterium]